MAVGEADLRRMKRQFSSLKNTFLHYEVKDEFIAAVADGLPNGTEEIQLAELEGEVARNVNALRALKAQNEETTREIEGRITDVLHVLEGADQARRSTSATLTALQQELEAAGREEAAMPPPPGAGPDEQSCVEAAAAAAAETRDLEARIAALLAESAELEVAVASEREETEVVRAQLAELQAQEAARGEQAEVGARFAPAEAWAEEAALLLGSLSGVSILRSGPEAMEVRLAAAYPTAAVAAGCVGACATGSHELTLRLRLGDGAVVGAALTPADVDVDDVMEAAAEGGRTADFVVSLIFFVFAPSRCASLCVVLGWGHKNQRAGSRAGGGRGGRGKRCTQTCHTGTGTVLRWACPHAAAPLVPVQIREVRFRVAAFLHRRALVREAVARFPGTTADPDMAVVTAPLGLGVAVQARLEQGWPAGDDVAVVTALSGDGGSGPGQAVVGLRLEGRGFAAAVEAVRRQLQGS